MNRRPGLSFAVSYALICGALFLVYFVFAYPYSGLPYRLFTGYLHGYAVAAGTVLHMLDPTVRVANTNIEGRVSLTIVRGCDGTDVLILFSAAVLASRAHPWPSRAFGVIAGAVLLLAANVVRICSLYFIGIRSPSAMEVWHLEIWPLVLMGLAVGIFLAWGRWATGKGGPLRSAGLERAAVAE
jgi:exosortase/archaeosortase family protein